MRERRSREPRVVPMNRKVAVKSKRRMRWARVKVGFGGGCCKTWYECCLGSEKYTGG